MGWRERESGWSIVPLTEKMLALFIRPKKHKATNTDPHNPWNEPSKEPVVKIREFL